MGVGVTWQAALLRLCRRGWDTDEIDAACEALIEACETGGRPLEALTADDVDDILDVDVHPAEVPALVAVARARSGAGPDADALQRALYDLDAFANRDGDDEDMRGRQ